MEEGKEEPGFDGKGKDHGRVGQAVIVSVEVVSESPGGQGPVVRIIPMANGGFFEDTTVGVGFG